MERTKDEINNLCNQVKKDGIIISPLDIGAIQGELIKDAPIVFQHPELKNIFATLGFIPRKAKIYLIWFAQEGKQKMVLHLRQANAKEVEFYRSIKTNA